MINESTFKQKRKESGKEIRNYRNRSVRPGTDTNKTKNTKDTNNKEK